MNLESREINIDLIEFISAWILDDLAVIIFDEFELFLRSRILVEIKLQSKIIYHCKVIDNFKYILRGYSNKCIVRLKDWKRNLVNKFSIFIYLCNC